MRSQPVFRFPPASPLTHRLLMVLAAFFLAQVIARAVLGFDTPSYANTVESWFALSGSGIWQEMRLWQLLSYFWIQPMTGVLPALWSLLMVYLLFPLVERQLGGLRSVLGFIFCGIAGGFAVLLASFFVAQDSVLNEVRFMGSSAATSGLVAILCWWWRDQTMNLWVVQPKGWQVLLGFVGLVLLQGLLSHPFGVVDQLGGVLMGVGVAAGRDPYGLFQRFRLWRVRKRLKTIQGGKASEDRWN